MLTSHEKRRYSRHILLPEVSEAGQMKLKAASVLIVGMGGLGAPLALYLAAAGIGRIGLMDDDVVDFSNLQRQILYQTSEVGELKALAAKRHLNALNPEIEVIAFPEKLTSQNAFSILQNFDVIADGTDNFATRYLINDACVLLRKPNVHASVFRFEGQVSVFGMPQQPCYRCLFPEPPPPDLVQNCAEAGVLGALVGIIGSVQALEVLKLCLEIGESLVGKWWMINTLTMQSKILSVARNPQCLVCGDAPSITQLIDYDVFCGIQNAGLELSWDELQAHHLIIDVREEIEWQGFNIGGFHIPLSEFPSRMHELYTFQESALIMLCASGIRSQKAQEILIQAGFKNVFNLKGGLSKMPKVVVL